jgi:prolyl oligopeptidase
MNKILLTLLLPVFVTACSEPVSEPPEVVEEPAGLSYPVTETVDHVDNYHGTEVADRYRWLEDDVRESEAVNSWVGAQNEVTFAYLDTIPERASIRQRMRELWDYERYSIPDKEGGRYFYSSACRTRM